jgi:FkbM family methyltransferase
MSDNESSANGSPNEKEGLLHALNFLNRDEPTDESAPGTSWEKGMRDFLGTFAFVKPHSAPDWRRLPPEEASPLAQELGWRAIVRGRLDAIAASSIDSWFRVRLNGVALLLPRYTLMIMRDCFTASANGELELRVETAHWDWMKSQFGDNTLFLDIGAAAGTMTVPYALSFPEGLRIVSFEPSQRARDYLERTLAQNGSRNVTVLPFALSDVAGDVSFMELPEDSSGPTPFLPEGSRLQLVTEELYPGAVQYPVEVRTLDSLSEQLRFCEAETIVVKIDVEGFEDKVLRGALKTLERFKPFLSIDIHNHPGRVDMTDEVCVAILSPLGYRFERMGHVLLASAG